MARDRTALARYKKLCVDSTHPPELGAFWAAALLRTWRGESTGEGGVYGPTAQHTIWINRVPEPKTVKNRVHLDIYARSLDDLTALGSTVVLPQGGDRRWTVMADRHGGEYCAFLRGDPPAERLHGLVVDSAYPAGAARWWARVYGAEVVHDELGFSTVTGVPGMPIATMDFNPVPEPKTVKNRIHWDVSVSDVRPLLEAGAVLLAAPGGDRRWYVLADPEGNEFCAFPE